MNKPHSIPKGLASAAAAMRPLLEAASDYVDHHAPNVSPKVRVEKFAQLRKVVHDLRCDNCAPVESNGYYTDPSPPATWEGEAAAKLGLSGEVTAAAIEAVFGDRQPLVVRADEVEAHMPCEMTWDSHWERVMSVEKTDVGVCEIESAAGTVWIGPTFLITIRPVPPEPKTQTFIEALMIRFDSLDAPAVDETVSDELVEFFDEHGVGMANIINESATPESAVRQIRELFLGDGD